MTLLRTLARVLLGAFLLFAGISHLTWSRTTFLAQVPTWTPIDGDLVVVASGVVEILLGVALLAWTRRRPVVGWIVAAFFVAVFPGNISQLVTHTDAFGLNTDAARTIRLLFQPVLVAWALWCTGAWTLERNDRRGIEVCSLIASLTTIVDAGGLQWGNRSNTALRSQQRSPRSTTESDNRHFSIRRCALRP